MARPAIGRARFFLCDKSPRGGRYWFDAQKKVHIESSKNVTFSVSLLVLILIRINK
jgi:hypothetical protein